VSLQKYFSHPNVVIYVFVMSPLKVKLGLQIGQKQLIATHLDQSNYLANQQHVLGFVLPSPPLASNALLSRAGMF
jgi:hypothetical protein